MIPGQQVGKRKQDIIITHPCQRIGVQSQVDSFNGNLPSEYELHQKSAASGEKKARCDCSLLNIHVRG